MSKAPTFFVAMESDCWHAARVGDSQVQQRQVERAEGQGREDFARLRQALRELDYQGQGVCLGIPSHMVLSAPIDTTDLPRKRRQMAMVYLLEERLPLEAERLVAQFLPATGGRALGLAIEKGRIETLIDGLRQAGVRISAICPTALLALAHLPSQERAESHYVLIGANSHVDLFRLSNGRPSAWSTSPANGPRLCEAIEADMLLAPAEGPRPTLQAFGELPSGIASTVQDKTGCLVQVHAQESAVIAAAHVARRVLEGRDVGCADFGGCGLISGGAWAHLAQSLRWTFGLAALLLVSLTFVFCWRTGQSHAVVQEYGRKQAALYARLYPNTPIPTSVRSRLRSDLARWSGVSGAGRELPEQVNALQTLSQVLTAVPTDLRLRIIDVRIGPSEILIDGQARTHGDAEILSQSLKRVGLSAQPPRTEALPKAGVSFTLTAKTLSTATTLPSKGGKP